MSTLTTITAASILCLSSAVHYEARGESLEGKRAVASVIMNRVESPKFPDTVCAVVKQRGQFSWYPRNPMVYGRQQKFATDFLNKKYRRTVPKAYFFTTTGASLKRPYITTIGGHKYYGL